MSDKFKYSTVQPHILESLRLFGAIGQPTGGFLRAVLENDLREACARADDINRLVLFDIVRYCWNELPSPCWGSKAKVDAWIDAKDQERRNTAG